MGPAKYWNFFYLEDDYDFIERVFYKDCCDLSMILHALLYEFYRSMNCLDIVGYI